MRLHTLCAKMLPYMDKELVRECGQRHLCYWREGPRFFKNMRDMVLLRKKSTVALRKYGRQTKLLVFLEWQKEIKRKRASREARKEERAAARLVAKQRAVALATARAQGQKFLIAQLEAEQATADKAAQLKSFARRERLQAAGRSSAVIEEDNLESDHSSDDDDELGEIAEERAAEAREAELVAKAAAAVASPHKASSSSLLQAFSSEKKEEPPAKPLLRHGIAQTVLFDLPCLFICLLVVSTSFSLALLTISTSSSIFCIFYLNFRPNFVRRACCGVRRRNSQPSPWWARFSTTTARRGPNNSSAFTTLWPRYLTMVNNVLLIQSFCCLLVSLTLK